MTQETKYVEICFKPDPAKSKAVRNLINAGLFLSRSTIEEKTPHLTDKDKRKLANSRNWEIPLAVKADQWEKLQLLCVHLGAGQIKEMGETFDRAELRQKMLLREHRPQPQKHPVRDRPYSKGGGIRRELRALAR